MLLLDNKYTIKKYLKNNTIFSNNDNIPYESLTEIIFNYIDSISRSLDLDSIVIKMKNFYNTTDFKNFLRYSMNNIIKKGYCYDISIDIFNERCGIIKYIFKPIQYKKAVINIESYLIKRDDDKYILSESNSIKEIYIKDNLKIQKLNSIKEYNQLYKIIDKSIKKLGKEIKKSNYCHICNPYDNLKENEQKKKCINCDKIYKLIKEIDSEKTTNFIGGRIKGKTIYEKNLTGKEKKERHYKNLIKFVKELENNESLIKRNKEAHKKNIERLYSLIEKGFGKKKN